MNTENNDKPESQLMELFPHILIFGGIGLSWLGLYFGVWIMSAGFIWYGVAGLIHSVRNGYHKGLSLRIFKPATQALIIVCAFLQGTSFIMLLLLIMDTLLLTNSRMESLGGVDEKEPPK